MPLIYIVEDDTNIREIESFALKNSGYNIADFESALEFNKALQNKIPDLILLDIMLPDEDGLMILKRLRSTPETKKIPIIMVTAKTTEIDKVKGLDSGADDYITKPFGIMELISRVKALLRRSGDYEEKVISVGDIIIDDSKHTVTVELLKLLMNNMGIVLKREVIMERIWGIDFEGESRTLDMHIKTLRKKLGNGGQFIKTVRNVGYVINGD